MLNWLKKKLNNYSEFYNDHLNGATAVVSEDVNLGKFYAIKNFGHLEIQKGVSFDDFSKIVVQNPMSKLTIAPNTIFRRFANILVMEAGELQIGSQVFFNNSVSINCLGSVKIGNNSLFGENVKIYDHNHVFDSLQKNIAAQGMNIGKVCIGNNCWIGSNVTILKDVVIGDNSIIGAHCLVYKSISANSILKSDGSITMRY